MKISQRHKNRSAHNWLVYEIGDFFLRKYEGLFKGNLYDLGAGESPYKQYLLQFVDEYIAVDWTESLHDTKADISADLNSPLPIESGVADTVVSFSVIEHLSEPQNMINEAYRILKPGGSMVLQVPWQWQVHEAPYDFFRFTPFGLEYLFEKAGFEDVVVTPQSGFFTTSVLKFNYFTRRIIRGPKTVKAIFFLFAVPVWTVGQLVSPILDKLDNDWCQESFGYFVVAKKR
jgi:SAM-dependent methyltransferase